jgi:ribonuclease HI
MFWKGTNAMSTVHVNITPDAVLNAAVRLGQVLSPLQAQELGYRIAGRLEREAEANLVDLVGACLPLMTEAAPGISEERVVVHFDGACKGNPGPSGAGFVILDSRGDTVREGHQALGIATNNVAEYQALIAGLQAAREVGFAGEVHAVGDSLLVVQQMAGNWKAKDPKLAQLRDQARALAAGFASFKISHCPREQNARADQMANQALAA